MTIERAEIKEDGTTFLMINGEVYEFDPADQVWLDEEVKKMTFGASIKAHRLCEKWKLSDVSKKLGISPQLLSAYENGQKVPSPKTAYRIAEILGMVPESVVERVINEQLKRDCIPVQVQAKAS